MSKVCGGGKGTVEVEGVEGVGAGAGVGVVGEGMVG